MTRAAARASRATCEPFATSGSSAPRKCGSGWVPITLSTMIFKGSGVRRATGGASKLRQRMPPMWRQ